MRTLRRHRLIVLTVTVVLTSCACRQTTKPGGEGRPLRFVFVAPAVDEAFFEPVKKGMSDAAALLNVRCDFIGTKDVDIPAQIALVRKASREYDGIAVSIIDPEAFDQAIQEATGRGIPVVAFNVDDYGTPNARLSAVNQNLYQAGRRAGEAAAPFIADGETVLVTEHSRGISALDDRRRGIEDALQRKKPAWTLAITGTTAEAAEEVVTGTLRAHPRIRTILCTGLADTEGAGLAVERHFGNQGYKVCGFDLSPLVLRLLDARAIQFTIDQQPYVQGFYPVVQLAFYCRYGIKPSNMDSGATILRPRDAPGLMELTRRGYR